MASRIKATPQEAKTPEKDVSETAPDRPMHDLSNAAVKKLIRFAKKRGYVTHDQINSVLSSEEVNSEQIEDVLAMFSEMGDADAENRVNKKRHARCAPAPACRPTRPPPKNARLSRRRLASAYRTTKSASSLCQSARASQSGSTTTRFTATTPGLGMRSIPPLRYPFLRRVNAEFVVVGDL